MLGCAQPRPASTESRAATDQPITWPDDWSTLLGQRVTIDGWAAEAKLGSMLDEDGQLDKGSIWIDGKRWPDGYYGGPDKRKHVRVTGTVIKRDDMPVYLAEKGTWPPKVVNGGDFPYRAGIPAYSKEELERYKWRFLLENATWKVLD